jgi:hypothetical protein
MGDYEMRRGLKRFVAGGTSAFTLEELETIEHVAKEAVRRREAQGKLLEAAQDAESAEAAMGIGWTHVRLVLDPIFKAQDVNDDRNFKTLWEIPFLVAVFVPVHGHVLHIFRGPSTDGRAEAVCGSFRSTGLDHVRQTYQVLHGSVREMRRFSFGLCENCAQPAPYELRWLPPQTERERRNNSVGRHI